MTVQELIDNLLEVEDKTEEIKIALYSTIKDNTQCEISITNNRKVECSNCDGEGIVIREETTSYFSRREMCEFPDIKESNDPCGKCDDGMINSAGDDEDSILLGEFVVDKDDTQTHRK